MLKMSRNSNKRKAKRLQAGMEALETRVLLAADWQNPINPVDVDANESAEVAVTPLDALLVINEIHDPQYADPVTRALPDMSESEEAIPAYVDVDADGFVSPLDALLVINELNIDYGYDGGLTSVYQTSNVIAGSRAALDDHVTEDTLVNQTVAKRQSYPAVDADARGNMVSVWQSFGQDGGSWGIFGQRYNADGEKVGEEFQVNTTTRLSQRHPSVAVQDDGSFMVVWQSIPDGGGWGIYGQAFDASGNPVGEETLINSTTRGNQQHPDVAAGDGSYTVVWNGKGNGDNSGIFAATVDASGNVSDEMLVNTYTKGIQTRPAVDTYTGAGGTRTWVSWDGKGADDSQGVFIRELGSNADQMQVNTQNRGFQHQSDISVSDDGTPVVVWKVYPGVHGKDVMARVFDANGGATDPFLVNQTTRHKQWMPSVDHLDDGSFAVAWWGRGDGDNYGVFLRTFQADGTGVSDEVRQNFTTKGVQSRPAIAAANSGYVVMWQGKGQGDNTGIFARFFETDLSQQFAIAAIDNLVIDEGDLLNVDADIVDLDGIDDSPTFSLDASVPDGMSIDPATGEITWQTDELDGPGTYEVTVTASAGTEDDDSFFSASETFMVTVNEVDTAPILATVADMTIPTDEQNSWTVTATDQDIPVNDLTYSAALSNGDPLPAFLVFNADNQEFTANPTEADDGVYEITVTVLDSTGLSDTQSFTLTVDGNDAPVVSAIPDQSATEAQNFDFDITSFFSDPDGDALTYSLSTPNDEPLPSWLSFDEATGTFSGTPGNRDIAPVTVTVTATDPSNESASDTFVINVVDVNEFGPDILDEVFVISESAADGASVGTVSADDPDPSDVLTYSITSGNANGAFAINSSTGEITVADNAGLAGVDQVVLNVQVSDGTNTDSAEVTVVITDAAGSVAYTLSAVDTDGNPLTTIEPGQSFELILSTEDLTADPTGVFSAFADIVYQTDMVSVNGDVAHSSTYGSGTNADLSAGLLDEAGGVDGIMELGGGVFEVLRVPMLAADYLPNGTVISFGTNATENLVTHPTLLFGGTDTVPADQIRYGTLDLTVDDSVDGGGGGGTDTAPDLVDFVFRIDASAANDSAVGTVVGSDIDGDTLSYAIVSGNTSGNFAIDSATGQITVADNTGLAAANPATLMVSASDGSNTAVAEVHVFATSQTADVTYTLAAENLSGNSVSSVAPGDTVHLVLSVQDSRTIPTGVFSAFADIGYPASAVSVSGEVVHSATYGSGVNAGLATAGLIDEAGGVDGITPLGGTVIEVLRVPMTVANEASGQIAFATNPTEDGIAHPTLLFGESENTLNEVIHYGSLVLNVSAPAAASSSSGAGLDLDADRNDADEDYDVRDAVFGDL